MDTNMEQPNKFEVPEELLVDFRAEIAEMKQSEVGTTTHLDMVNPDDLTEADFAMWQRVKHYPKLGKITAEDFAQYEAEVLAGGNSSRRKFLGGLVANTLTPIWAKEQWADFEASLKNKGR